MKEWFCAIEGRRYGPVDEGILRQWVAEGRMLAQHLVWTEGMVDWVRADSVPGLFVAAPGGPPPLPTAMVLQSALAGTEGGRANSEITRDARDALRGHWGLPIAFCLLLGLLQSVSGVPFVGSIVALVLAGPFMLGKAVFFLTFIRRGKSEMGMLFAGFKNFGNALCAYLLRLIFVGLWSIAAALPGLIVAFAVGFGAGESDIALMLGVFLAGIPGYAAGIIAGLMYSQTFYLMAEDRTLDPLEALRKSKALMRGHKGKLFCLYARFIGWSLLCIPTLFIGLLWLAPYMAASFARFHEDLRVPVAGADGQGATGAGNAPAADFPASAQRQSGSQ